MLTPRLSAAQHNITHITRHISKDTVEEETARKVPSSGQSERSVHAPSTLHGLLIWRSDPNGKVSVG